MIIPSRAMINSITFVFIGIYVSAAGCARTKNPAVAQITGQVIIDGKPAEGAVVTLHPINPDSPPKSLPTGNTDANGEFKLTSYTRNDGAPPGEYKVTVFWQLSDLQVKVAEGDPVPVLKQVPAAYRSPSSTPEQVTIEPGVNKPISIEISTGSN